MSSEITISDFSGGLNLADPTIIADNDLADATNVYYDNQGILSTRKGIEDFGNNIATAAGIHSIYFTQFSNGNRYLLLGEGTNLRLYNETTMDWDILKADLTDGLRLSFITYKDNIYLTNGTDEVQHYDGAALAALPAVTKCRYLAVDKDVCYGCGVDAPPYNLLYTAPGDELKNGDFANEGPIDSSAESNATSLKVFNGKATVGTERGVYVADVFGAAFETVKIDYNGDVISNRSVINVENDQLFLSTNGYYSMSQRRGATGSYRADSFSKPIQKLIDRVEDKTTAAAHYYKKNNNVYLSINDGGDRNNSLYVYSVLVSSPSSRKYVWTKYENINANDFCEYVDADGDTHLLAANAFGGQVVEIETGYSDNGIEILSRVKTKTFDFDAAEMYKTFARVDVGGLVSQAAVISYCLEVDGVETCKSFEGASYAYGEAADDFSIGEEPLGENVLGGGAVTQDGVTYFPYVNRRYPYQSGYRMAIKLESNTRNAPWKFTKANIDIVAEPTDAFYNNYIS